MLQGVQPEHGMRRRLADARMPKTPHSSFR